MAINTWKKLTIADLRKILSADEAEKLNTLSLETDQTQVVNDIIDLVADTWRGAFAAKGYLIDVREHFTPPEYHYWILVHARHAVWTRFPNSGNIALDDPREKEYEKALKILDNPSTKTSTPDYSEDPVLSGDESLNYKQDGAILVPNMRISTWLPLSTDFTIQTGAIAGRDIFAPDYPQTPPNTTI